MAVNVTEDMLKDMLRTGLVLYAELKAISTYQLLRNLKTKDISAVSGPVEPERLYTGIQATNVRSKTVKGIITEFSLELLKNYPIESLTNYYNNIHDAKIRKSLLVKLLGLGGTHNGFSNSVKYFNPNTLYHELFHLASTVYNPETGINHTGFSQKELKFGKILGGQFIGESINEGYTCVLAHRHFGDKSKPEGAQRKFEFHMATEVEKIVGKEIMGPLYLEGNLRGLIDELAKYSSEEEAMKFICSFDFVSQHYGDMFLFKNSFVQRKLYDVYSFLVDAYEEKLYQQACRGEINEQEYNDKLDEFIVSIGHKVRISGARYRNFPKGEEPKVLNVKLLNKKLKQAA